MDRRERIARRVAQEVEPGSLVNLGIGLPSLVANFIPAEAGVFFQAENGVIGMGARPPEGMEDPDEIQQLLDRVDVAARVEM